MAPGKIKFELTASEQRALKAIDRVVQAELKMGRAAVKAGDASAKASRKAIDGFDKSAKARGRAFGSGAQSELAAFATRMFGIQAAISLATSGLRKLNEERKRGAQLAKGSEFALSALAQVSGGSKKEFARLTGIARQTFAAGGAGSLAEAGQATFDLKSVGLLNQRNLFNSLFGIVGDTGELAKSVSTVQTTLGKGAGSPRQILSKAFKASESTQATTPALLAATARSGVDASLLGIGVEELLGGTAITSRATLSAERGGTLIKALLAALAKKGGFEDKGLATSVQEIKDLNLSPQELVKFFPERRARSGFGVLSQNINELRSISGDIGAAGQRDLVGNIIESRGGDPLVSGARQVRIAENKRLQSESARFGGAELRKQTLIENFKTALVEDKRFGDIERTGIGVGLDIASSVGIENEVALGIAGGIGGGIGSVLKNNPFALPTVLAFQAMFGSSENIKEAATELKTTASGGPTLSPPDKDP